MPLKPPSKFSKPVRRTLHWLAPESAIRAPGESTGESRYALCHAERLHESLTRLPRATGDRRCLVVGSWGLEVPYLIGHLGWEDVTCVSAPVDRAGLLQRRVRRHPNEDTGFEFTLLEHDVESGPLPFESDQFGLVVYWGCLEHLRHDPEFSFYELNRVTAMDGTLSLVTDNAISFQATHSLLRGQPMPMRLHWPGSEGHWRLYTPNEIEQLAVGTGWRVDELSTIVSDPPVYWRWWKRWLFRKLVADFRKGFGLIEPYWDAFILASVTKTRPPTRGYPTWLYKDEKIRQLKVEMLELVSREEPTLLAS